VLAKRPDAAKPVLLQALALEPDNARAVANLAWAEQVKGQTKVEALGLRTAPDPTPRTAGRIAMMAALAPPDITPKAPSVPAPVLPMSTADVPTLRPNDHPEVAASLSNAASESEPTTAVPVAPSVMLAEATPMTTSKSEETSARLELSNGGGITGAAARMRKWLALKGITTHRLTNQRPYDQRYTVIQYRSGQEEAAQRVAQLLPAGTERLAVSALRTDVRVLLGRDWHTVAACLEHGECGAPARVAQTSDSKVAEN
jgi:hypothetical protein